MSKLWTEQEDKILTELYPEGKKDELIKLLPDRTWKAIKTRATKIKGITYKRRGNYVNEAAFSKWSPNMAYVLGYIFADGCITRIKRKHTYAWYFQINSIDKQIIQDISDWLEWEGKLSTYHRKKNQGYYSDSTIYRISIGSNKIVSDLRKHGVTRNKSLSLQPPNNIPDTMLPHFIRGFWDGDGTFTYTSGGNSAKYLTSATGCGSKEFTHWLALSISTHLEIEIPNISKRSRKFWDFHIVGYNAKRFTDWIYKDADLHLHRKKEILNDFDSHGRHINNQPKKNVTFRESWSNH